MRNTNKPWPNYPLQENDRGCTMRPCAAQLHPFANPGSAQAAAFLSCTDFNYASLTAAILCVFLFAGSRILPMGMMQKSSAQAVPMMAAVEDASAEVTSIPMITWGIGVPKAKAVAVLKVRPLMALVAVPAQKQLCRPQNFH